MSYYPPPGYQPNYQGFNQSNHQPLPVHNSNGNYPYQGYVPSQSNEKILEEENLKLRKQIMELNDSNFNLKEVVSKQNDDKKAAAEAKFLELESELKFKNEDVKRLRKELQAAKQKNFAMTKKLESIPPAVEAAPDTTSSDVVSIHLTPDKAPTNYIPIHPTITNDIENQSMESSHQQLDVPTTSKKRARDNNTLQSAQISRLTTKLLGDCHDVITTMRDDAQISNLEIMSSMFSESFAKFVGNVREDDCILYTAEIFYHGVAIMATLLDLGKRYHDATHRRGLSRKPSKLRSIQPTLTSGMKDQRVRTVSPPTCEDIIVKALNSSIKLLHYLIEAYGIAVLKPNYVQDIIEDGKLNMMTDSEDILSDDNSKILSALRVPHKDQLVAIVAQMCSKSKHILKEEFKIFIRLLIDICHLDTMVTDNTNEASSLPIHVADLILVIYRAWQQDSTLHACAPKTVDELTPYFLPLTTTTDTCPIPCIFIITQHPKCLPETVREVVKMVRGLLACDEAGDILRSWIDADLSLSKNFVLPIAVKMFYSTDSTAMHIHDPSSQSVYHGIVILNFKIEIAKFVYEVIKRECGLQFFIESSSISILPTTTPDSSVMTTSMKPFQRSTFFQRVAHQLVSVINSFSYPNEVKPSTILRSLIITYGEIICHIICRVSNYISLEDRRVYFGIESLLRVQPIILQSSQDQALKDMQKLLFNIHTLLS